MAYRRPNTKLRMIEKYLTEATAVDPVTAEAIKGIIAGRYSYKRISATVLVDSSGKPVEMVQPQAPPRTAHAVSPPQFGQYVRR